LSRRIHRIQAFGARQPEPVLRVDEKVYLMDAQSVPGLSPSSRETIHLFYLESL
jgi:hypothetical protein